MQKQEPIESICYLFFEMSVSNGESSKVDLETIIEMIRDLMSTYEETQILSKREPTDSHIIVNYCWKKFLKFRSVNFINAQIDFLNEYLQKEEKELKMNMLGYLAKIDGNIDEREVHFYNHIKKAWGL